MIRWLRAVRICRNVSLAVVAADADPPPDAEADRIFDQIDANRSGKIDMSEVAKFMLLKLKQPSSKAHTLLRAVDSSGDGEISRKEWRRGWAAGALAELRYSLPAADADDGGELPLAAASSDAGAAAQAAGAAEGATRKGRGDFARISPSPTNGPQPHQPVEYTETRPFSRYDVEKYKGDGLR